MIAAGLPSSRAMMHRDMVLTMIDRATLVVYPYLDRQLWSWSMTKGDGDVLSNRRHRSQWDALAAALAADKVTIMSTDEDIRGAEREQWDAGQRGMTCPIERDPG